MPKRSPCARHRCASSVTVGAFTSTPTARASASPCRAAPCGSTRRGGCWRAWSPGNTGPLPRGRSARGARGRAGDGCALPSAPAPAALEPDCLVHARAGATDRAIACFQAQAAASGLSGEVALLEIARLRRDVSGDLDRAERALDEYRRRFPHGTLSAEAGIARVELLLRLGRPNDALVEARALPEGEGDFWRAVCCSAKLGRRDEARAAFDGYLARPDTTRRREAQRRRAELAP